MSSTCYNPFLYGWHNEAFRKEFVKMIPALSGICRSRVAVQSATVFATAGMGGVGGATTNAGGRRFGRGGSQTEAATIGGGEQEIPRGKKSSL